MRHIRFYAALLFAAFTMTLAFAANKDKQPLKFRADGTFKIVQFTDLHFGDDQTRNEPALITMRMMLDEEKPDLVVYTGDLSFGTETDMKKQYEILTAPCTERNIPYVITFGNHDNERFDHQPAKLYEIVCQLKGCLNTPKKESVEELFGYTNQVLPILSNKTGKAGGLIYMIDSNCTVDIPGARNEDWIHQNQVDWYRKESNAYTKANGGFPLPALAFFHIPLIEFKTAYENPKYKPFGGRLESECCSSVNSGIFTAFVEQGDVMGAFVGHDHDNDYAAYLNGIVLGYGRHTSANYAYRDICRGARMFTLYDGKREFDSWVRFENHRVISWMSFHYPDSFHENLRK